LGSSRHFSRRLSWNSGVLLSREGGEGKVTEKGWKEKQREGMGREGRERVARPIPIHISGSATSAASALLL